MDFEKTVAKLVSINAEKESNSRILPISPKAIEMLNNLPKNGERIFANADHMLKQLLCPTQTDR